MEYSSILTYGIPSAESFRDSRSWRVSCFSAPPRLHQAVLQLHTCSGGGLPPVPPWRSALALGFKRFWMKHINSYDVVCFGLRFCTVYLLVHYNRHNL